MRGDILYVFITEWQVIYGDTLHIVITYWQDLYGDICDM